MSIAAISSSFVAAVRERAPVAAVEGASAPPAAGQAKHEGRRHELVDAMKEVLGVEGDIDRAADQAVFRFAQALMHDLRSIEGAGSHDGPGRGHAWGRRSWSDLPQRIDALATAAAAAAPAAPPSDAGTVTPPAEVAGDVPAGTTPTAETALPPVEAEPLEPELPLQPNPLTTTSAALHLMQVPSSRLLEAYAALREALGNQAEGPTSTTTREPLAAFLDRLSGSVAAETPPALPAGSVLNLTA
jgi:hypothetical protein